VFVGAGNNSKLVSNYFKGKEGYIEIDANFETLDPPAKFGPEFLTYVVWAITPEGRASNLGELQVSGDDGELRVTTELQAFGLIGGMAPLRLR
jgi:hypothetical protein